MFTPFNFPFRFYNNIWQRKLSGEPFVPPFSPLSPTSATCRLWLNPRDPANTGIKPNDGDPIHVWADKSIYARNVENALSNLTTFAKDYWGSGMDAVSFSASYLTNAATQPTWTGSLTIACVVEVPVDSVGCTIIFEGNVADNYGLGMQIDETRIQVISAETGVYERRAIIPNDGLKHLLWIEWNGTYFRYYLDGDYLGLSFAYHSFTTPTSKCGVGTYDFGASNSSTFFSSDIVEYNGILSAQDKANVQAYLAEHADLTIPSPFSPSSYSNLFHHQSATNPNNTGILPDPGDSIASWKDLSGNGNDANQAFFTNQPVFRENIQGGMPALQFDSANAQTMLIFPFSHTPSSTECTGFVVYKAPIMAGSQSPYFYGNGGFNGIGPLPFFGSDPLMLYGGVAFAALTSFEPIDDVCVLWYWRYTSSGPLTDSGINATDGAIVPNNYTAGFPIASINVGSTTPSTDYINGYVFELYSYERKLTNQELLKNQNYILGKYVVNFSH